VVLLKIVNIIAVAKMREGFDLEVLNEKLENTEINSSGNWLKMRLKPEDHYIAFYKSGKFLTTGLKKFEDVEEVTNRVIVKLKDVGIQNPLEKVEIVNIVLTEHVEFDGSLEDVLFSLDSSNASYEPEQFPGLFYKDVDGLSYTLFQSGKMIVTGVKDLDLAKKNVEKLKNTLKAL